GPECLLGQSEEDDRVLAAGEEQHRPLELRGDLAKDVDSLGLELVEVGQHRDRRGRAHDSDSERTGKRLSSSSRSSTAAADSVGVRPDVSRRSSGSSGSSYGAETPVNSSISPANAAAWSPFGSRRAHSSSGVATWISTNGACCSTSDRACRRISSYGEIAETTTTAPARARRDATQPMRAMFVSRSSFEKPRPFERWVRT